MSDMTATAPGGRDVEEDGLQLGEELGSGGQGRVSRVVGQSAGLVFKQYKTADADPGALKMLVDFPLLLQPREREFLLDRSAWPLARVMREDRVSGFLMREIPENFYAPDGRGKMRARELTYLLYKPKPAWGKIARYDDTVRMRVEIAMQFARLVRLLHARSLVVGDVSMNNLLWVPGDPASVFLIDCDTIRQLGSPPVLSRADTPDWEDPLLPTGGHDLYSDRYKLALLVGRVLTRSPYLRPGEELKFVRGLPDSIADKVRETLGFSPSVLNR